MAFLAAAIGAIVKGIAGWTIAGIAVGRILLGVAINMGLSLLMQRRVNQRQPGMKIAGLSAGEERPLGFPLGRCATAGHLEYINSYGRHNKTPNAFLVLVISVSDLPGVTLNRLIVNDEYVTVDWDNPGERGAPITTFEQDNGLQNGWVRWYDGTQTEADPYLVEKFSGRGDRPWTEDHIGTGTAYAVITFRFRARKFRGVPRVRFELGGVPVYDPRKDTTAGGDGLHRLDDPATWEPSNNLAVLTWNVLRGIPLPEGGSWGGETPVEDLPLANWAAGMNACDEAPTGRPRYHGGLEVLYGDEPASVIDEFLAAGLGQITETGGVVRARWGAPSPAVYWLDDGSISVSDARRFSQGEGLAETTNALAVGFMSPAKLWQPFAVEPLFNAAWEAEDGRRLLAELQLPACWALGQARHLQRAYARDARRRLTHTLVLPPDAQPLECLDTIRWTSGVQGYENKLFEVVEALWLADGCVELTLRERDPDDYSWTAPDEPEPEVETPPPDDTPTIDLPEWDASGVVLPGDGGVRRPGIRLLWDPEAVEDARAVEWELRLAATQEVVARGVAEPLAGEALIVALPATAYEVRGRAVSDARETDWTAWTAVTTPDVRLGREDLAPQVTGALDRLAAEALSEAATVDAALTAIARAELDRWALLTRVTDAGVIVEPDSGQVRIVGLSQLDGRLGAAEVTVDGLAAEVALRTTMADVNNAISLAVLDPTQIPAIDDLELRISNVEVGLAAQTGSIDLLAETLTVSGQLVAMGSVTARLDSVEGDLALKAASAALDGVDSRLTDAEVTLSTLDVAAITQTVTATRRQFDELDAGSEATLQGLLDAWADRSALREASAQARQEISARVGDGLAAEAAARLEVLALAQETAAGVVAESVARAAADEALAQDLSALGVLLDDAGGAGAATAEALDEVTVRVTSAEGTITAQGTAITALESGLSAAEGDITANAGAIGSLDTRVTSAEGTITAQGTSLQQLTADVGDVAATVTQQGSAIATLEGHASATYTLRVGAGGAEAGLELVAADDPVEGPSSALRMRADRILLDGTVEAAQIAAGSITASRLALGERSNLWPDYAVADADSYSSAQAFAFFSETNAQVGGGSVGLTEDGTLVTGWAAVDAGAEVRVRAGTRNGFAVVDRTGTVFIEFGEVIGGEVVPTRQLQVVTRTNGAAWLIGQINATVAAGEGRFRFVLVRSGNTSGSSVRMGGLAVWRRTTGELIVNGAITAEKLAAGEIITDAAQIGALTVGTIQLKQGAVTVTRATDVDSYALEPGEGWVTVAQLNFTPFGADVMLRCEALITVASAEFTFQPSSVRARITWRGEVIGALRVLGRVDVLGRREVAPLALIKAIATAGAGAGALRLQVSAGAGVTGLLSDISLDSMEFRR